jgi:GNAT superfamily N-acetyltransferase
MTAIALPPQAATVTVCPVASRGERSAFIRLPWDLHRGHRQWVPPLLSDEEGFLDPRRNPALSYCDVSSCLAWREARPVGRVMGIVNRRHNALANARTARFGLLECPEDLGVAEALLAHVETWARSLGMQRVVGPMGCTDQDPEGLQVEGFEHEPTLATYVNFAYLPRLVEAAGYVKEVDYVVYRLPVPDPVPPVYLRLGERLIRSGAYALVEPRTRRELRALVRPILKLMADTFRDAYGFVPPDESEMEALARRYAPLLDPRFVKAVRCGDNVVGFIVGMPNMAEGLRRANGRLLPFGLLHLLRAARRSRQLDLLVGGVTAECRGRGVDALLAAAIFGSARKAGMTVLDSHHEQETNTRMRAEMERLGAHVYKRYRIYGKALGYGRT